jgi:tRNA(fMet)-specific endonuclease VapC
MHLLPNVHNAMLGKRYLLDTNALVALLQGHQALISLTKDAQWLGVSIINVLEFLGFDGLSAPDQLLFEELLTRISIVDLNYSNASLMDHITTLRKSRALKLPDAIVMASAALHQATVITNDAALLKLATSDAAYSAQAF